MEECVKKLKYIVPLLPGALSAGLLLDLLEHYEAHMDAGFGAMLLTGFCAAISLIILAVCEAKKRERPYRIVCITCFILCAALVAIASTIPNCPMCDGWENDEFHLLSHWIKSDS